MRNPKKSVDKIPLRKTVGKRVADALEGFLDKHPRLEGGIQQIISTNDPHARGPADREVAAARQVVDEALNIDRRTRWVPSRTALDATIYDAWVVIAKDPDVHVPQWLNSGTPMGIREEPINVGIFPESYDRVPDDMRRSVEAFGEKFINYCSLG